MFPKLVDISFSTKYTLIVIQILIVRSIENGMIKMNKYEDWGPMKHSPFILVKYNSPPKVISQRVSTFGAKESKMLLATK